MIVRGSNTASKSCIYGYENLYVDCIWVTMSHFLQDFLNMGFISVKSALLITLLADLKAVDIFIMLLRSKGTIASGHVNLDKFKWTTTPHDICLSTAPQIPGQLLTSLFLLLFWSTYIGMRLRENSLSARVLSGFSAKLDHTFKEKILLLVHIVSIPIAKIIWTENVS